MAAELVMRARGLVKRYGHVTALDGSGLGGFGRHAPGLVALLLVLREQIKPAPDFHRIHGDSAAPGPVATR